MPVLYIITGSNGAGKSSIGPRYLPLSIQSSCDIFDGDKLFMSRQRELWAGGIRAHKEAKKMALAFVQQTFDTLVENAILDKTNFVYEGHFTNEATWDIPKTFKAAGYEIHLIFLGLTSTDLSELRVVDRVKEGGHYVDPKTVSSNYYGNLEKLNRHFSMFDTVQVIDTSETEHKVLCVFAKNEPVSNLAYRELPIWFTINLTKMAEKILHTSV